MGQLFYFIVNVNSFFRFKNKTKNRQIGINCFFKTDLFHGVQRKFQFKWKTIVKLIIEIHPHLVLWIIQSIKVELVWKLINCSSLVFQWYSRMYSVWFNNCRRSKCQFSLNKQTSKLNSLWTTFQPMRTVYILWWAIVTFYLFAKLITRTHTSIYRERIWKMK